MEALLQRRRVVKQKTTRLQTFVEDSAASATVVDATIRLERLEELSLQFNLIQDEIEATCNDPTQLDAQEVEREQFDIKYFKIKAGLLALKQQGSRDTPVRPVLTEASTMPHTVKLPVLQLPTFDGNYQDWSSFYDLFVALVHNHTTLAPAQKLHYLKTTLRGEAARLLSSLKVTDANYAEAWNILVDRYQNTRHIVQSHIRSLFNQAHLQQESASGLRRLIDTTVEHVRALHVLKEPTEHWGSILIHTVVERLDPDSRRQWELSTPSKEVPSFEELRAFMEQRCRALDAAGVPKTRTTNNNPRTTQVQMGNRPINSYHASKSACVICKLNHLIYHCPQFAQLSPQERSGLAKQHALCFNCLRTTHSAKQCNSGSCRKCNRKHHTLLHFENNPTPARDITFSNSTAPTDTRLQGPAVMTYSASCRESTKEVLLLTAWVNIRDQSGQPQRCRVLIDSGSQSSFVTEACAQRLRLNRTRVSIPIQGIGNLPTESTRGLINLELLSLTTSSSLHLRAFIIPRITGQLPRVHLNSRAWPHLSTLRLADPTYHTPGAIDVLLGADVLADLLVDGKISSLNGSPSAQNTVFGWVLFGQVDPEVLQVPVPSHISSHLLTTLDNDLKRFWELEETPRGVQWTKEELECESHFQTTHQRAASGRYVVSLPFKENPVPLGKSRNIAMRRFLQLEGGLLRDEQKRKLYQTFMSEYMELNHMKPVTAQDNSSVEGIYYLPHHAIIKDSTTTKLRVVFDASSKTESGVSLNDNLLTGPKLQSELIDIILRFRTHKIALVADIEKMYRQIDLLPSDTNYQRILWRFSTSQPIVDYNLTTVTYGVSSAPYLATRVLQQLAEDEERTYPLAARVLKQDFYMDDLISGSENVESALLLQNQLRQLLSAGGFHLQKWV